jgi:WD40 repeat protein
VPTDRRIVAALLVLVSVPAAPAQELTERGTFKGPKFRANQVALSPDGKILAAGGGIPHAGELMLYDVVAGKEIAPLSGYTGVLCSLAFSADGKRLASGGYGPVQVWDVSAHKEIVSKKRDFRGAIAVALNRDGTRLAAVGGGQVKLWEVGADKELAAFKHHAVMSGLLGAAFSGDLATLAIRNYQEIDRWDTATGKEKSTFSEHRGEVGCMIWSADDKTLIASSTRYTGKDYKWKGDVKLWDAASGKERAALPGPFGRVLAMALSPDGKTLALLDSPELQAEADLKLVDAATGRQHVLRVPAGYSFLSPAFTPEGKLLVTGASVDALRLWEVSLPKRDKNPS